MSPFIYLLHDKIHTYHAAKALRKKNRFIFWNLSFSAQITDNCMIKELYSILLHDSIYSMHSILNRFSLTIFLSFCSFFLLTRLVFREREMRNNDTEFISSNQIEKFPFRVIRVVFINI